LTDKEIGACLAEERKFMRLRQETVAEHLGMKRQTLSAIENGTRPVRATELAKLCNLYRVNPAGIIF
jgi:transcriptional regulator with XRE-family HTH domain